MASLGALLLLGVGAMHARAAATNTVTLGPISARTLNENCASTKVGLTGIGGGSGGVIGLSATSSDTTILPDPTVTYTSPQATGTLALKPVTNAFGTVTVTVIATNDKPSAVTNTFAVTVNAINKAPQFTLSTNVVAVYETNGAVSLTNFLTGLSAGRTNETSQTFSLTLSGVTAALFSAAPAIDTSGNLTFTVATNKWGTNVVGIKMQDNGGTASGGKDTTTNAFTLRVACIHDNSPVLFLPTSTVASLATNYMFINENARATNLTLVVSNLDVPLVALTAASSNTNLFNVALGAKEASTTNTSRTLTITTVTNQYGTGVVTLVASDIYTSTTNTIALQLLPINHAPTGAKLDAVTVLEDHGAFSVTNVVAKLHGNVTNVTLSFASTNASLVAVSNIVASTNASLLGANRGFTITPTTNGNGKTLISVIYTDTNSASTTNTFLLTVTPVNDPPSFSLSSRVAVVPRNGAVTNFARFVTNIVMGPADEAGQKATFSLKPSVASAFKRLAIDTNGTLTVQVATNITGFFPVSVWMKDSGGTANGGQDTSTTNQFYIAVTNVVPATTITVTAPLSFTVVQETTTNVTVKVTSSQRSNVLMTATAANPAMIGVSVSGVGPSRTLTITGKLNQNGTNSVDLICDDGLTTYTRTVPVLVTRVNHPPAMTGLPTAITLAEDAVGVNYTFTVTDVEADTIVMSTVVRNPDLATATLSGSPPTEVLRIVPKPDANGTTFVEVRAQGGTTSSTNTIPLTITAVNDPPYYDLSTNSLTVNEDIGPTNIANFLTHIKPAKSATNEADQKVSFLLTATSTNGLVFKSSPSITPAGTLSFQTTSNSFGSAKVSVVAQDTGGTTNGGLDTFELGRVTNVTMTSVGSGYSDKHNVSFSGGGGSGADGIAILSGGTVARIDVTARGSGYTYATATIFDGSGAGGFVVGTGAKANVNLWWWEVDSLTVTDGGAGYVDTSYGPPKVVISGDGIGATAVAVIGYPVTGIRVDNPGSGYSGGVNVAINRASGDTCGAGATATATLTNGAIAGFTITNPGSNYIVPPLVTLTPVSSGSGAAATAATGSKMTGIVVTKGGSGYTSPPTVTITGGVAAGGQVATATAAVAPPITFDLNVNRVYYPPIIGKLANLTLPEGFSITNIVVPLTDKNMAWSNLQSRLLSPMGVTVVSDKPMLVRPYPMVRTVGSSNFTIMLMSMMRSNSLSKPTVGGSPLGSATISVSVDDGLAAPVTNRFMVTVNPINDAPMFSLGTNLVIASKYLTPQVVSNQIRSVLVGPTSDETEKQTWKVSTSVSPAAAKLFVKVPRIDTNGTLTFTPGTNAGSVTVSVTVSDSGGKLNGGKDTSDPRTFTIRIPANTFPAVMGTYNGLFYDGGVAVAKSGFVRLDVDSTGAFAGYLLCQGASNGIVGRFDASGRLPSLVLSNVTPNLTLATLSLDLDPLGSETITGAVTCASPSFSSPLTLVRSIVGTSTPLAEAAVGDFAVLLPGGSDPAPVGHGFGRVHVGVNGLLSFDGTLADGTVVTQQVGMTKYAEWPLYAPAYKNGANGMLLGWLTFTDRDPNNAFLTNRVAWVKLAAEAGTYYPTGFVQVADAVASAYDPWVGLWSSDAVVTLTGGGLASPLVKSVSVGYDTVVVNSPGADKLSLTIDPPTGLVSGSFVDVAANRTNRIAGVVLQNTSQAKGCFLGASQSGSFELGGGITLHPASQLVSVDDPVTLTVAAAGGGPISYQWQRNGVDLTEGETVQGVTSNTLSLLATGYGNWGDYTAKVTTADGTLTSAVASVAVMATNAVTVPYVGVGWEITLIGDVMGNGLSYRWEKDGATLVNGLNISGATTRALTVRNATTNDAGNYVFVVGNGLTIGRTQPAAVIIH